jgi:capsular polysaccharide transport system ATP-binding protein
MIELQNISKSFGTQMGFNPVLQNVNLTLRWGEKVAVLGSNGSGKSTLVKIISGISLPDTGQIKSNMSISWPLGLSGGYQGSLTGIDNLKFLCRIYNAAYEPTIEFVRSFTDLGHFLNEPIKTYSSGMKAKFGFAASMAIDFDCYLIDEVLAVGDSKFQKKCHDQLFGQKADRSLLLVSHQEKIIREYCQKAYVLHNRTLHPFESIDDAFAYYKETLQ